jgi:hypothetical protein
MGMGARRNPRVSSRIFLLNTAPVYASVRPSEKPGTRREEIHLGNPG